MLKVELKRFNKVMWKSYVLGSGPRRANNQYYIAVTFQKCLGACVYYTEFLSPYRNIEGRKDY